MKYIIVLLIIVFLIGCSKEQGLEKKVQEESKKDVILIKNEELIGNSYSLELFNEDKFDKECWATLEINSSEGLRNITKYAGIIKSNESVPLQIEFGEIPQGRSIFTIVPDCKFLK